MGISNLRHMLRAPKALKALCCRSSGNYRIYFTDIRDALTPQENSLESLALDFEGRLDRTYGANYLRVAQEESAAGNEQFEPMKSFVDFKNLKVFKIPALCFEIMNGTKRHSLINIFPPRLETLHLTRFQPCFMSLLEAIEQLLVQKSPEQNPSLRRLILETTESTVPMTAKLTDVLWRGTQESAIGILSKLAAAQDVSIDVIVKTVDE